ncbi:hypothetical protein [Sedimentisphaera salicampi]|uniref:Uncharacterized protein n=1 Tax=Sedimentisphaera salicampi TaxID=1941349 RepID=A0A1W6LK09_9BACT|nr:hypothetical protein [Sedimentisphaera salicampi]ARN56086.1 hypothetical protein STSP1_00457 [Sedimentisphaera salicampi]OXU15818.1 hypothetical protein SMSP1_00441 [Sedimentisphaera salicampi]
MIDEDTPKINLKNVIYPAAALVILAIAGIFVYNRAVSDPFAISYNFAESKVVGAFIAMFFIVFFTELKVANKLRMIIVCITGMVAIGMLLWPIAAGSSRFDAICFIGGTLTLKSSILVIAAAFLAGMAGCALGWPSTPMYGSLAALTGFGLWGLRTGDLSSLLMYSSSAEQQAQVYTSFRWEIFFWLAAVLAAHYGSFLTARLFGSKRLHTPQPEVMFNWTEKAFIVPLAVCSIAGYIISRYLVLGIMLPVENFGIVHHQPLAQQIAFGLITGFGIAAYLVRKHFKSSVEILYLSVAVAAFFTYVFLAKESNLETINKFLPPNYFNSPMTAVLPFQFIIYGCLGVWGGWFTSICMDKKHEEEEAFQKQG